MQQTVVRLACCSLAMHSGTSLKSFLLLIRQLNADFDRAADDTHYKDSVCVSSDSCCHLTGELPEAQLAHPVMYLTVSCTFIPLNGSFLHR